MKEWILEKVMHWCGYQNWIAWRWSDTFKLTKVYPTNREKIMMSTKDTYTHFNVYKNNKWVGALRVQPTHSIRRERYENKMLVDIWT